MVTFTRRSARGVVAAAAVLLVAGCGTSPEASPDPPVTGKLAIKGDPNAGARIEGAKVWFRSVSGPTRESVGVVDHDGTFALATVRSGGKASEGAPAGDYVVRVDPPGTDRGLPFHVKYRDYRTSGLRVTIPAPGELTFELDRPAR